MSVRGLASGARDRLDVIVLAVGVALFAVLARRHLPLGIAGLGLISGSTVAIQAIGVILVVRSNRIINFAQVQLGALSGVLFYELVRHSQLVWFAHTLCGPCFRGISPDVSFLQTHPTAFTSSLLHNGYGGLVTANFWISLVLAFCVSPLLAFAVYVVVVRRFSRAPRLIVTVATLAIGQVLAALTGLVGAQVFQDQDGVDVGSKIFSPIKDFQLTLPFDQLPAPIGASVIFHSGDAFKVAVAVLLTIVVLLFYRFAKTGIVIRGAADDASRAQTLGINVGAVTGIIWIIAGGLSAAVAILEVYTRGTSATGSGGGLDVVSLVPILAAAVFARFHSVSLALASAVLLGVMEQGMQWNLSDQVPYQVLLSLLVAGSLLLQRNRVSRGESAATAGYLSAREARPIPAELRHHPVVERYIRWTGAVLALVLLGGPFALTPLQMSLASVVVIYAIVGLSLLVLTGWAGQISLGQFAFAAVGAYATAMLHAMYGVDMVLALVSAGLAGGAMAALVGVPALRLRGLNLAVATLAFSLAVARGGLSPAYLGRYLPSSLDRPVYLGVDLSDEKSFYYLCCLVLLLTTVVLVGLRRSRTARALIAVRDNENAGQSFGINLFRLRLGAFVVSGFIAGVAGGLFAFHQHGVNAQDYAPDQSVTIFLMVVLGGLGSISGPLLGAAWEGVLLLFSNPLVDYLGTGLGVLAILLLFPGGIGALVYQGRDALLRRIALRYRVEVPSLLADARALKLDRLGKMVPRTHPGGGTILIPRRYGLRGQWSAFRPHRNA